MSDPTLIAGIIGATGSIIGTIGGVILGARLNNKKAKIGVYIDNKINVYYLRKNFCMYLPLTVTNEGNQSATITTFEGKLISPTGQSWLLYWTNFAEDNSHNGEGWTDGKAATPILVHGNSGLQHYIKLVGIGETSDGFSDVALSTGKYELLLKAYDRNKKVFNEQRYNFQIETEPMEVLAKRRKDHEDFGSWWFLLYSTATQNA
ncbi:MAG: hypothetical protein Q8L79_05850 [Methylobacter sp.]|uniref:hypothetical protein n=1 Tax=Methylobacter sp. TaxID=2051955 RepID=UPI0027314FB4|nr:hypothetical protein [Methylobacter sp.]MDP1664634.1 hypothetical protein [Methylobacter sp.]MDP1969653.1 hypothetical protein [Methylobacter sp.]